MNAETMVNISQKNENTALVVFTGGVSGFNESLSELRQMQKNNWKLNVVLSTSAEYIFKPELVKRELEIDKVYLESENTGLRPLYEDASILIIPTFTTNAAAKMACGITDNLPLNLLSHFIMTNSPVVVAKDSCDLSHEDRIELGMGETPDTYKKVFDNHLKTIESFGVKFVNAVDIYQAVQAMFFDDVQAAPEMQSKQQVLSNKLIRQADILEHQNKSQDIVITHNAIVTPLAKEKAREFDIDITRLDN